MIDFPECKFQIKTNSITVTLFKANKESWTDLKPKKALISKKTETAAKSIGGNKSDGLGDLMGMMKEMYENGDDETKRMISESW